MNVLNFFLSNLHHGCLLNIFNIQIVIPLENKKNNLGNLGTPCPHC